MRTAKVAVLLGGALVAALWPGMAPANARGKPGHHSRMKTGCSDPICGFMSIFSASKEVAKINKAAPRRIPKGLLGLLAGGAARAAGVVRSKSGATARVAPRAAGAFQCFVSALDRQGYPIRFMGGYRAHGSVRGSLHPAGLALDINQFARNVTRPRMPANEIALANGCGLVSGAQWRSRDSGHEQLGGWTGR